MRIVLLAALAASSLLCAAVHAAESPLTERSFFAWLSLDIDGVTQPQVGALKLASARPSIFYSDDPLTLHVAAQDTNQGVVYLNDPQNTPVFGRVQVHTNNTATLTVRWQGTQVFTNTAIHFPDEWDQPLTAGSLEVVDDVLTVTDPMGSWHWDGRTVFDADVRGRQFVATLLGFGWYPFTTLPGDFDANGLVAQGDLDLLLLNWGGLADGRSFSGLLFWPNDRPDGTVGQAELDRVLLNWGRVLAPPDVLGAASVPEPATVVMLLVAAVFASAAARSAQRR